MSNINKKMDTINNWYYPLLLIMTILIVICYSIYFTKEDCNIKEDCLFLKNNTCLFGKCMNDMDKWVIYICYIITCCIFISLFTLNLNYNELREHSNKNPFNQKFSSLGNDISLICILLLIISFPITVLISIGLNSNKFYKCGTPSPTPSPSPSPTKIA